MRKNRPARRSRRNGFTRLFGGPSSELRRAPRRGSIERLEERQVLSANVGSNPYFEDQWHLDANGQQTEFDPTSPTFDQTLALVDNNVIGAWEQLLTGSGVQIGVVSGGFDLTHEDLVGSFVTNLAIDVIDSTFDPLDGSFNAEDTDVSYIDTTDSNGTAVAGIIGANNNDLGVVGIAYEADLVPIRAVSGADATDAATAATALRWRVGMVEDLNGDGIVDGVDNDGDGIVDGYAANEVIDVYFISGDLTGGGGSETADPLDPALLAAIADGYNAGRATWNDLDGDGIFDLDEVDAKGAIYIVPAGDDAGTTFDSPAFQAESQGLYDNSQYNGLANSRYTIAVGAVGYDGRYEENATGVVSEFSEIGPNVLLVAPSGTNNVSQASDLQLNSGLLTTDLSGEDGQNQLPVFGSSEVDGDYFPDTDYTSTFGGTEAAAAQVAAVVGLMLEANPELTNRDVEQILLMSASQIDQFSESWITNANPFFQDTYTIPNWNYTSLDLDGDGELDAEDIVIPESLLLDPLSGTNVVGGYFNGQTDLRIPDLGYVPFLDPGSMEEIFLLAGEPGGRPGVVDAWSPASYQEQQLRFTNDAGYTISQGYGFYLEAIGYAHGMLDAELAVELAAAWEEYDLYIEDQSLISTRILDAAIDIRVQGAAVATMEDALPDLIIPGGIADTGGIDTSFYEEFNVALEGEELTVGDATVGWAISNGPFWNPDGDETFTSDRGATLYPIPLDQSLNFDYLSVEWVEVTSAVASGDIDHLRLSLISPDGSVSDLTPYTLDTGLVAENIVQFGQHQQGYTIPGFEALDSTLGLPGLGPVLSDFINGSEDPFIAAVPQDDAIPAGSAWTWTTNQHYGSKLSVQNNASGLPSIADISQAGDGQWYLAAENWGTGDVELNGIQVTFHGTETEPQRIEGKIGVDDNAQNVEYFNTPLTPGGDEAQNPTPDQLGDGVFNFNRYVEFGEVVLDEAPTFDVNGLYYYNGDEFPAQAPFHTPLATATDTVTVVLDDGNDGVHFDELTDEFGTRRIYRTVDPETGIEYTYPVVDRDAYLNFDNVDFDELGITPDQNPNSQAIISALQEFDPELYGAYTYANPALRKTDGLIVGIFESAGGVEDPEAMPLTPLPGSYAAMGSDADAIRYHRDGTISSYQNFDYSQESFAAGVVVKATQYRVDYNETTGAASERQSTEEVQYFVTGADGNYYFDVASTPAPPDIIEDPVGYAMWHNDYGFTLEYDIEVVDEADRLWDKSYAPQIQLEALASVDLVESGKYNVQLFAPPEEFAGLMTTVRDVNFLLAIDPEEVQVSVGGGTGEGAARVILDLDGDGVVDATDGVLAGFRVYVDSNSNGVFDEDEISSITDEDGVYELQFDPKGDSSALLRVEFDDTEYRGIVDTITLPNFEPGDVFIGDDFNFYLKPTASFVTGFVWNDIDEDGVFDATETPFDGTSTGINTAEPALFVYYDANEDGAYDPADGDIRSDVTAEGAYSLEFEAAGSYQIRLDTTNDNVSQTFPFGDLPQLIVLMAEETLADVNFGVKDLREFDYGDLPSTYETTVDLLPGETDPGPARHRPSDTVYLGSGTPDLELGPQPTINADGDDNDGNDDEDGVTFVSADIEAGSTIEFDIVAHGEGRLYAWVDFDNNGIFDESEMIFDGLANIGTGVTTRLSAETPLTIADADRYAARFRWGPFGVGPTGFANEGEVEDLWLTPDAIVVSGEVRLDVNNDGTFEAIDTAREGIRVFFDRNLDGDRDPDEPSSVTNAAGEYSFEVAPSGIDTPITIRVEESTLSSDEEFLVPPDGIIAELGDPGEQITANFLLAPLPRPTQVITGTVFADDNNNGAFDESTESGYEGVTVELLQNIDTDPELEVIATSVTNQSGVYSFGVDNTGLYEVRIVLPAIDTVSLSTTGGETRQVAVTTGETVTAAPFGLFDERTTYTRDYGDLSTLGGDNYATTIAEEGPSHLVVEGIYLGSSVDADSGQLTSANGSADDDDFTDDEDGVVLLSDEIVPDGAISFNVTATGDATSRLNMWVDFDDDGEFQADEQIVTDLPLVSGVTTQINRIANSDTSTTAALLAVRTRWGTAGVGPTDQDRTSEEINNTVGEVEDQFVRTSSLGTLVEPGIPGDYDGSGVVDAADEQVWRMSYGAVGADLPADGNGNGFIDAGDYTIWRDAYDAAAAVAEVAASTAPVVEEPVTIAAAMMSAPADEPVAPVVEEPAEVPPVVTMPIVEDVLEPVSYDADAFAPMALLSATETAAVDESLSVEDESPAAADDALAAALLEWSFEGVADQDDDEVETGAGEEESAEDSTDDALAEAFAL